VNFIEQIMLVKSHLSLFLTVTSSKPTGHSFQLNESNEHLDWVRRLHVQVRRTCKPISHDPAIFIYVYLWCSDAYRDKRYHGKWRIL